MWFWISVAIAGGLEDCDTTWLASDLLAEAAASELSFGRMDAPGFQAHSLALEEKLACVREPLPQRVIARVHRVEALAAFVDGRKDRVEAALAGLFSTDPGNQIPIDLLPDGHPVRMVIPAAVATLRTDPGGAPPALLSGQVLVDGLEAQRIPQTRASLLQQVDGDGNLVATHYRWPDETGFAWVAAPVVAAAAVPAPPVIPPTPRRAEPTPEADASGAHQERPWARRVALLGGTAASLLASGTLYGIAAIGRAEFDAKAPLDASATEDERAAYRVTLEELRAQTNGFSYACYAASGVGLALGVSLAVTW